MRKNKNMNVIEFDPDAKKIGSLGYIRDEDKLIYMVDLEDTAFLNWALEIKNNRKKIKRDDIDFLLFQLQQNAGLYPYLLDEEKQATHSDRLEAIKELKKQIAELIDADIENL